jgi:alkylation response protein AidB-like acyl-CoA dehydrogenase
MHDRLFDDELRAFRDTFRKWVEKEIVPHHDAWEREGIVPRSLWEKAGAQGYLCTGQAEEYGGLGLDFRFGAVVTEEISRVGASGVAFNLHSDIVAPYVERFGTDDQKKKWLPDMATGACISAVAMTEPGTGSDLQGIATKAVLDGDEWVINGSKTFISNGILSDLVVVACRTDDNVDNKWQAISLIVVERGAPGFKRGKKLEKVGMHAQDTAELHFEDCRVPKENLLGSEPGQGFIQLMEQLAPERLVIAVAAVAGARSAYDMSVAYVKEREAFGRPIAKFQNTRFKLAEMKTEVDVAEAFLDQTIQRFMDGEDCTVSASQAKYWTTEMLGRVVDQAVQFFGGYGFMREYPIARAYADARVQRIYGGTTEIMKEIIARSIV